MPANGKTDVIRRQWEMLRLIPHHDQPGRSAAEIAAALDTRGYPVTRRTIERDLENLAACMPLEVQPQTRPQTWRWQRTKGLDVPGMEIAEAMALFMTRDTLASYLPSCFLEALQSRFQQASKTLAAVSRTGSRAHWSDRIRVLPSQVVLSPPKVSARILQTLQHALLNEIAVDVLYQALKTDRPPRRILFPRGLILRGSQLYLIAHQKGSDQPPHHYALQRFTSVRLKELEPWPKEPFSLDAFLADGTAQFGDGRTIHLRATISAELHKVLRDYPLSDDMTVTPENGELRLAATVRDTWALHTWLLGHAEHIAILQPVALRRLIAARLKAAARQYD